jgi:hypothetical protein
MGSMERSAGDTGARLEGRPLAFRDRDQEGQLRKQASLY